MNKIKLLKRNKKSGELIQICFQCHSLICLDFMVNNLYFIIVFKIEKKVILPIGGGSGGGIGGGGGGIGGSGGGFGGASRF